VYIIDRRERLQSPVSHAVIDEVSTSEWAAYPTVATKTTVRPDVSRRLPKLLLLAAGVCGSARANMRLSATSNRTILAIALSGSALADPDKLKPLEGVGGMALASNAFAKPFGRPNPKLTQQSGQTRP
jgi:hypothetical protein